MAIWIVLLRGINVGMAGRAKGCEGTKIPALTFPS